MEKQNKSKILFIFLFVLLFLAGWTLSSKTEEVKEALADLYGSALSFLETDQDELFPPESLTEVSDLNFKETEESLKEENQGAAVFVSENQEEQETKKIETEENNILSPKEKQINQMKDKIIALEREIRETKSQLGQMQKSLDSLQDKIEQLK